MCASHCFCVVSVNSVAYLTFELIERANPLINPRMRKAQLASCFLLVGLLSSNHLAQAADPAHSDQPSVAPADAISKLKEGNGRYTSGTLQHPGQTAERRTELANTQHPFATILSCSDSRVPPEIIFDQGVGDLFIVRVAGNVINDEGLGSIEYSIDHLGTRLILVLGHQSCGAVKAAKETIAAKDKAPGHIKSLVTAIKPAVEATAKGDLETTIKANVKHVVDTLRSSTPILKAKVDSGQVQVIGGYYSLDTGAVTFLDQK
jgi:carbonic anhydrase